MDEPSEGLAPVMVQQLERRCAELRQMGYAILLVEQNFYSALGGGRRGYIVETGRIVHTAPSTRCATTARRCTAS